MKTVKLMIASPRPLQERRGVSREANLTVNQRSDLDAFAALGSHGRAGIDKCGVRHALADAVLAVVALEEESLVVVHARPVVEGLIRVVTDGGGLAGAVRVAMLDGDEVVVVDGGGRGEAQRVSLHGAVDGPPHVDDAVAALQQLLGVLGVVQLDAPLGRARRLVDVHAGDGGAGRVWIGAAHRVVEEGDLVGAGDFVQQQLLHFRVVDFLDVFVVDEFRLFGRDALDGLEGVLVQPELVLLAADVVHLHLNHGLAVVSLRSAFGLFLHEVVWFGPIFGVSEEV